MNKNLLIVLGVIVALVVIVGGWLMSGYNRVVTMDENVKTAWAQVDNQLKRRFDLIPNLVETVKGYAAHEKEVFEHLADARTKYFQAPDVKGKIEASGDFERALSRLLVLQETYPAAQGQRELPEDDGQPGRHREPPLGGAEALQRRGAHPEYLHPHRVRPVLRRPGRGLEGRVLPGAGGREGGPEGEILTKHALSQFNGGGDQHGRLNAGDRVSGVPESF